MSKFFLFLFFVIVAFTSCENSNSDSKLTNSKNPVENSIEEKAKAYIENNLKINTVEKYSMKTYEAFIDADSIKDAFIVVQRPDYAKLKAEKANVLKNFEKMGNVANQNYLYYYNGKTKKFATTMPVGANVYKDMEVEFKSIISPAKKEIIVKYYILDSKFASYYTEENGKIFTVLNHPIYTSIGKEDEQVYSVKYNEGTFSIAKDIDLYLGEINPKDSISEENIKATNKCYLKFMFDPRKKKYVTKGI